MDFSDNFGLEKLFISCTPIFETETMFRGSELWSHHLMAEIHKQNYPANSFCLYKLTLLQTFEVEAENASVPVR